MIATWIVHWAAGRGIWPHLGAAIVVLLAASIRPNGWFLIPIAVSYWVTQVNPKLISKRESGPASLGPTGELKFAPTVLKPVFAIWTRLTAGALVWSIFLGSVVLIGPLRRSIQAESPEVWLRKGVVVLGYDPWHVPMPADDAVSDWWVGSLGYGLRHPLASARLAVTRVVVELAHVRPFYSIAHNAVVLAGLAVVYPLAVLGFIRIGFTKGDSSDFGPPNERIIVV